MHSFNINQVNFVAKMTSLLSTTWIQFWARLELVKFNLLLYDINTVYTILRYRRWYCLGSSYRFNLNCVRVWMDLVTFLPHDDILFPCVFSHLSVEDLFRLRQVSHSFRDAVEQYFTRCTNLDLSKVSKFDKNISLFQSFFFPFLWSNRCFSPKRSFEPFFYFASVQYFV